MSERRKHMDCTPEECLVGDPPPCLTFRPAEPSVPEKTYIYELTNGTPISQHRVGFYKSEESARRAAQELLDGYVESFKSGEWADEDTESLSTETLEWVSERWTLGGRELGDPYPAATYGVENGSKFIIKRREVLG